VHRPAELVCFAPSVLCAREVWRTPPAPHSSPKAASEYAREWVALYGQAVLCVWCTRLRPECYMNSAAACMRSASACIWQPIGRTEGAMRRPCLDCGAGLTCTVAANLPVAGRRLPPSDFLRRQERVRLCQRQTRRHTREGASTMHPQLDQPSHGGAQSRWAMLLCRSFLRTTSSLVSSCSLVPCPLHINRRMVIQTLSHFLGTEWPSFLGTCPTSCLSKRRVVFNEHQRKRCGRSCSIQRNDVNACDCTGSSFQQLPGKVLRLAWERACIFFSSVGRQGSLSTS
jgi:hypothetical protein